MTDNESQARRRSHVRQQIHSLYEPLIQRVVAAYSDEWPAGVEPDDGRVSYTVSGTVVDAPQMPHALIQVASGRLDELNAAKIYMAFRKVHRPYRFTWCLLADNRRGIYYIDRTENPDRGV